MSKIAVVGYHDLPAETAGLVDEAIRVTLSCQGVQGTHHDVVGMTCLAPGAQQLFARAVADLGGDLEVVVPHPEYRGHLPEECRAEYDALLARARAVHRLPATDSDHRAAMDADRFMLALADRLFAVWDGTDAGADSTAELVTTAHHRRVPVTVIWPDGARHA